MWGHFGPQLVSRIVTICRTAIIMAGTKVLHGTNEEEEWFQQLWPTKLKIMQRMWIGSLANVLFFYAYLWSTATCTCSIVCWKSATLRLRDNGCGAGYQPALLLFFSLRCFFVTFFPQKKRNLALSVLTSWQDLRLFVLTILGLNGSFFSLILVPWIKILTPT